MTTVSSTSTATSSATTGYSALKASDTGTGIDYSALVEAAVASRLVPADRIDSKITANEARISAYGELQDLLQAVGDSLDGLRNRTASTGSSTNLFGQRTAYLSGGGSASADDVMAVSVEDGTETGTYSIEVVQLATRHKIGGSRQSSQTDALGLSGKFSIGVAGGSTVSVEVGASDSLADIRDAINAQKGTSGVAASIVKVSDTEFQLVLTASDTGKAISLSDDDGVLQGLGVANADGSAANELVAVQDAVIAIDGVQISRASNTIDDAIDGVSIDLYAADPGETISMEVSTDLASIKTALSDFVTAYNSLRAFIAQQQATNSDGTKSDEATLFADSLLRQVGRSVSGAVSGKVPNAAGEPLSFATLGITLNSDSTLELDESTLNTALINRLGDVQTLLGLNMTSDSSDLKLLRYDNGLANASFTLDVDVAEDGTLTAASVDGDSSLFEVSGSRIIGRDGTAYEGLVFVYTGASASVAVSFSQGLADTLSIAIDALADGSDGDIAKAIDDLEDADSDLQTRSDRIRSNAEDYRSRLTAYYARLEQKAEEANLLLQQLTYSDDSSS